MSEIMFKCPNCGGDGKETCHNPDHGFYQMVSFNEQSRLGCPCCGHNPKHKVLGGGECETCNGNGIVTKSIGEEFITGMEYGMELEKLNQ